MSSLPRPVCRSSWLLLWSAAVSLPLVAQPVVRPIADPAVQQGRQESVDLESVVEESSSETSANEMPDDQPEVVRAAPEDAPIDERSALQRSSDEFCSDPGVAGSTELVDRMRQGVYKGVCESARWIDGFFGDERIDREVDRTFGRVGLALYWDEVDELSVRGQLRVKITLPQLENRWNAFVGRFDEEDFVTDREERVIGPPEAFRDSTDREWLAGLGYSPVRNARRRLDFDAGVKLDFPADPFVRGRYRRYLFFGDYTLTRLQQTVFWRREEGYGTTSLAEVERSLSPSYHLRWRGIGTWAEKVDGVDWQTSLTLYQNLGNRRALAYTAGIDGETDAPVTVPEYGLQVRYRQAFLREWLFFEIRSGLEWKRKPPVDGIDRDRERAAGLGFGIEMYFGDWSKRFRRDDPPSGPVPDPEALSTPVDPEVPPADDEPAADDAR